VGGGVPGFVGGDIALVEFAGTGAEVVEGVIGFFGSGFPGEAVAGRWATDDLAIAGLGELPDGARGEGAVELANVALSQPRPVNKARKAGMRLAMLLEVGMRVGMG
jgi:hypothetical protein